MDRDLLVGNLQFRQVQAVQSEPLTVRILLGIVLLALFVGDQLTLLRIDEKDAAGLQSGLLYDVLRLDVEYAYL